MTGGNRWWLVSRSTDIHVAKHHWARQIYEIVPIPTACTIAGTGVTWLQGYGLLKDHMQCWWWCFWMSIGLDRVKFGWNMNEISMKWNPSGEFVRSQNWVLRDGRRILAPTLIWKPTKNTSKRKTQTEKRKYKKKLVTISTMVSRMNTNLEQVITKQQNRWLSIAGAMLWKNSCTSW